MKVQGMLVVAMLAVSGIMPLAAQAGPVGGGTCQLDQTQAYTTDTYHAAFYGGSSAHVAISGDGDTDLDVYVYDENGNLITSEVSDGDQIVVSWEPIWTGTFTIQVVNRGDVYNRYTICIG